VLSVAARCDAIWNLLIFERGWAHSDFDRLLLETLFSLVPKLLPELSLAELSGSFKNKHSV